MNLTYLEVPWNGCGIKNIEKSYVTVKVLSMPLSVHANVGVVYSINDL